MRRAVGAVVVLMLLLSGCGSSDDGAGGGLAGPVADSGFVAGDGSIVILPVDDRPAAPDLAGPTPDGGTFRLVEHLGAVAVRNIWAPWCAPCRAEAPALAALAEEFDGRGVQFAGLDTRDSDVPARAFVERFAIPYPNVIDSDGRLQLLFADSLPPQAIPSTVVIDPQGRVAARALGKVSEASLRGIIEQLAPSPPSPSAAAGSG
jgi:thiol-disulfide isomerase/thioredoxin